jgi:bifunctional non-homologous end joining protein LigD
MGLERYWQKRDFGKTPEPRGVRAKAQTARMFVVQKHAARNLHYDFRLELDGVLKSWAVPKGPSLNPADKRLAVEVEDHPVSYGSFEGSIPKGQYGGGNVIVWDTGKWIVEGDAREAYRKGHLRFELEGEKLKGRWSLVRSRMDGKKNNWLLIKGNDEEADTRGNVLKERPESVLSGKMVETLEAPARSRKNTSVKVAAFPKFQTPLLPTLVDKPPRGEEWQHEPKFDGYRTLVFKNGSEVRCLTRKGLDWSDKYGAVVKAAKTLKAQSAVIDGEIVVLDAKGRSNFSNLQEALKAGKDSALVLMAFDLLYLDGENLERLPLTERQARLTKLLGKNKVLRMVKPLKTGKDIVAEACALGLEGVVSKKKASTYQHDRSLVWLKAKCQNSGTFMIVGYVKEGPRSFRSLVMAEVKGKALRYAGRVGTGFNERSMKDLLKAMKPLEVDKPPLKLPKDAATRNVVWLRPELLAEIQYRARTAENILRQASFKGLRPDKEEDADVADAMIEPEKAAKVAVKGKGLLKDVDLSQVLITHPERHLFGDDDVSKLDVAVYYAQVAEWMLPHILGRPLSLIRCTSDNPESCFYQRHAMPGILTGMDKVQIAAKKGSKPAYMYFDEPKEILELAQAGVVEVHPWNCHVGSIETPDQIVMDLDPDEALPWKTVVKAATGLRDWLEERGFTSFVKTTGGKGLHVVVPFSPRHDWEVVKGFAKSIAEAFAEDDPGHFTAVMSKEKRKGRIFIDYLRNGRSATAVAPYSLRARPGGPVALPFSWQELARIKTPKDYTFATVPKLLKTRKDPWADFGKAAVPNAKALDKYLKGGR